MTQRVVIVVDDNAASRMLPALVLRAFNVTVLECESANDVWTLLTRQPVSHVLLDISMPGVSGAEVAQRIRADGRFADVNLVAYTADARLADSQAWRTMAFDQVLIKPIQRDDLLRALNLSDALVHNPDRVTGLT